MTDPIDKLYAAPEATSESGVVPGTDLLGWSLLALPICGAVLVGLMTGTALGKPMGLAMVIGCAILAHVDAKRWRVQSMAFGIVLLFVLFYPLHFQQRAKRGARLGTWAAIAVEILALVTLMATIRLRR